MSNYTIKSVKKQTHEVISEKLGIPIATIVLENILYKKLHSSYKGSKLVNIEEYTKILATSSDTDIKVVSYIVSKSRMNNKNEVLNKSKKHIKVKELANYLDIHEKSASRSISKLVKLGFIKKNKRVLTVNPYIIYPKASDELIFALQVFWGSDFKIDFDELYVEIKEANKKLLSDFISK